MGYVDLKVIVMFRSKSGKIMFYELQFLTKAQAALKSGFHKPYSVLRTIFGEPELFNQVIRKSLQKMSPEARVEPLDFPVSPHVKKLQSVNWKSLLTVPKKPRARSASPGKTRKFHLAVPSWSRPRSASADASATSQRGIKPSTKAKLNRLKEIKLRPRSVSPPSSVPKSPVTRILKSLPSTPPMPKLDLSNSAGSDGSADDISITDR